MRQPVPEGSVRSPPGTSRGWGTSHLREERREEDQRAETGNLWGGLAGGQAGPQTSEEKVARAAGSAKSVCQFPLIWIIKDNTEALQSNSPHLWHQELVLCRVG